MKRFLSITIILLTMVAVSFSATPATQPSLAERTIAHTSTPAGRLFQFERSTNRNYICYDVNVKNGVLDEDEPIKVYWIRVEEGGMKKELSWIQKKLAFGYKVKKYSGSSVVITLSPSDKMPITVCKKGNKWVAICSLNGKSIQMTKMFAQMRSPNSMHCDYVEVYGTNTANGAAIKERINNK